MNRKKYGGTQPRFLPIWMHKLWIVLGCAIGIGLIGTGIGIHYYRNYVAMDYDMRSKDIVNQIENWHNDIYSMEDLRGGQMRELWKTAIHWVMDNSTINENGGFSVELFREDRKQIYAPKEDNNYIILSSNVYPKENRVYECSNSTLQKLFQKYDELVSQGAGQKNKKTAQEQAVEIYIEDVYLYGGKYVPGKVTIQQKDTSESYSTIKEYDFTPSNIERYEHIELDQGGYRLTGPIRIEEDDQDKIADQLLQDYTEQDMWNGEKLHIGEGLWDDDLEIHNHIWGGSEYITTQSRNIGGILQAKIVVAAHYSIFKDYGWQMAGIYCGILLIAVLLSLILAYHTYMVRKNQYEMDVYRRETTNAMAHDLKTPLTAISGYAENLVNKVHTEKTEYYCQAILENATYMNRIVSNILELAKIESTHTTLVKENVSVYILMQKCVEKYEGLLEEAKLKIDIQGDAIISADQSAMLQITENLIGNAMKYAKAETVISVVITQKSMCISNTIANKLDVPVEELVKPFVKGQNSRNGKKGSGMGLAIVKHIVDECGYHLTLKCEEDEFLAEIRFS